MSLTVGTNTYISADDAETYFSETLRLEDWYNVTDRINALVYACRLLESRVIWFGTKTSSDQALQWPRRSLLDPYGNAVDNDTTPSSVQYVQCELALYLASNDPMLTSNGIDAIDVDGLKINMQSTRAVIPHKIFAPLTFYGRLIDDPATVRLSR